MKSNIWLLLDARGAEIIKVGFWDEKTKPEFQEYQRGTISLLEFLEQYTEVRKVRGIVIVPGPGGFSTVRAAALFSNLATFAMQINAYSIKPKAAETLESVFERGVSFLKKNQSSEPVIPIYAGLPNITKATKK